MIRINASGLPWIVRVMQGTATMRTALSQGLPGQLGIKIKKRRKKDGIGNKKMGHFE